MIHKDSSFHQRAARFLLLSSTLIFATHSARAALQAVGNVTNVTLSVDATNGNTTAMFWLNSGGVVAVTPIAPDVVRVRFHYSALISKEEPMIAKPQSSWPSLAATFTDQSTNYLIQTSQLDLSITKTPFKVHFKDKTGFFLLQEDQMQFDSSGGSPKFKCIKVAPTGEAYLGFGEYAGTLNRRGHDLQCYNINTYGWGQYQNPMYMNFPFFYGVDSAAGGNPAFAYGLLFQNPATPLFRLGTQTSNRYSFEANDGELDYFFFGGGASHTMAGVLDRYTELTGRPTMLPKWALGYEQSRFTYDNQSWLQSVADGCVNNDIPLDVIFLDLDYFDINHDGNYGDGTLHQLTINSNYPDPAGMISYCAAKGVKVVPLIDPWLQTGDPFYSTANSSGYFVRNNDNSTLAASIYFGTVSWIDYTSTAARNWWKGKIMSFYTQYPFAGIWNDLTEPEPPSAFPPNALFSEDGRYGSSNTDTRRQFVNEHNYWALRQESFMFDTFRAQYPTKRPYVLSRSGFPGIQRYACGWSGDTQGGWGNLQWDIGLGVSVMISGQAYFGHDIGGFAGSPDNETMTRFMEWAVLLPQCRNHAGKGTSNREPYNFSSPYKDYMRNSIKFRYKLMPYLYTLAYTSTIDGEPMNTPTIFHFMGDSNTFSQNDNDFMVGDYLLAAPVYTQGATTRSVYLPGGPNVVWYYYPTNGVSYSGGQTVTVNAPLGTLPLFVRSGAIIPMGPSMQYMNQFTPGSLDLNCWPSSNSVFTLYEDAGEGWDFTNSTGRVQTTFTSVRGSSSWDFTIGARQGNYNPGRTNYYIYVYNPQNVQAVTLNGLSVSQVADSGTLTNSVQGWVMTTGGKLAIKIPDNGTQQVVHVDWSGAPPPPDVPQNVTATAVATNQINVSWSASSGATSYFVLRGGSQVGTTTSTTYSNTGLSPSTQYCYTVIATNSSGASAQSSPAACATTYSASCITLDGVADSPGYVIASRGGTNLYAMVRGTTLYVAAPAAGNSGGPYDSFVFVTDATSALTAAPWAKAGQVAVAWSSKPWIADEASNNYLTWNNGGAAALVAAASTTAGVVEGTLDLTQVFGSVPSTLYVAYAPFATADSGALAAARQIPAGNGDGNLDANEFVAVSVAAIHDENCNGVFDSLGPPATPTNVVATGVYCSNEIDVSWAAPSGATSYIIRRDGLQIATTSSTTYSDTGLSWSSQFCYTVIASNSSGVSAESSPSACAWTTSPPVVQGLDIPGTWNGWAGCASPWFLGRVYPPGTPGNWYTNTIYVAASGGDITSGTYQFKLRANCDWCKNWGLNSAGSVNIDGMTTLAWSGSTNASITVSNGFYYSFRVMEPTLNANATITVLRTPTKPVSVMFSGVYPGSPHSNDSVTVSITLSAAKSSQEHIYVRYTTNHWTTSQFVEATGSGTAYTATIPAMPNGTIVEYYILSSTATTATGLSHSTADALTLNLDSNDGNNFIYGVNMFPWPGAGGYPSSPANIHYLKEEAVVGNGHITVMLDQNGTLYDILFPSIGQRSGGSTANEGYYAAQGPQWPFGCGHDAEANGEMNLLGAMGGILVSAGGTNNMYWLKNETGTNYTDVGQRWTADDSDVVLTSNRLNAAGYNNITVQQYDFVPSINSLPIITDCPGTNCRTNSAVHVKRFLLTNNAGADKTMYFYWDANFNIKGDNAYDVMSWEGTTNGVTYNAMIAGDNVGRLATGSWCGPNGYGGTSDTEYNPDFSRPNWAKSNSVYFATVMKLVTNAVTGAGSPADVSWRDYTSADNNEGWIAKMITIPANQTVEMDVMTVGSWEASASATGTHAYWGRPMITWFYTNNMANVQTTTETWWSNWVNGGVTVNFPDPAYDRLFKRSLIVSKLQCDAAGGAIIAGMHNGAYPYVWPRDGVYAAVTFDRTGHPSESAAFFNWLKNADRPAEAWGAGYFYQKYTTDGKVVWRNPQVDETAVVPWGMYYHYLATGDGAFLSNNWDMAYTTARASSGDTTNDYLLLHYDSDTHLMWSWNVWEDKTSEHLYSNATVVRGLRDAANIADYVGSSSWATEFRSRATDITGGITNRINQRLEPSDISHLGMVMPFEVITPNNPLMTNMVEWISGRQFAGGFMDDLVEHSGDVDGLVHRYNHKIGGELDTYWNGGPWTLASAWYGEYFARWQDYVGGKLMINTNKMMLDKIIAKLGPMGLAGEQIAVNSNEQKYAGFWLQTAWPNTWESHSTLVDEMMMFLDYKPLTNNTCAFAPKLPDGWSNLKFNNLSYRNQRFNVTVSEGAFQARADINKLTTGALNIDIYLRIPAATDTNTVAAFINGTYIGAPAYDPTTGRVHVQGPLNNAAGTDTLLVTYGNYDSVGDTIPDWWRRQYFDGDGTTTDAKSCASCDADGDGMSNLQEYLADSDPTNSASLLHIISVQLAADDVIVTWMGGGGTTNMLQYSSGANGGYTNNYMDIPPQLILPALGTSIITNQIDFGGATNGPSRFYRVRLVP